MRQVCFPLQATAWVRWHTMHVHGSDHRPSHLPCSVCLKARHLTVVSGLLLPFCCWGGGAAEMLHSGLPSTELNNSMLPPARDNASTSASAPRTIAHVTRLGYFGNERRCGQQLGAQMGSMVHYHGPAMPMGVNAWGALACIAPMHAVPERLKSGAARAWMDFDLSGWPLHHSTQPVLLDVGHSLQAAVS